MRWFVSILALANFSVYLWGALRPNEDRGIEFAPLEIGVIRLLGESTANDSVTIGLEGQASSVESAEFLSALALDDADRASATSGQACGEIVWFKDANTASQLSEALTSAGADSNYSEEVRQVPDGYWAMIPPQEDRRLARQQLAALQDAKVDDTWLMPSGPFRNAISLGLYSESKRAESRAESIRKLGFNAMVQPNFDRVIGYRVGYSTNMLNAESIRAAAISQKGISHRQVPCK